MLAGVIASLRFVLITICRAAVNTRYLTA